jgi:hypothetical protein
MRTAGGVLGLFSGLCAKFSIWRSFVGRPQRMKNLIDAQSATHAKGNAALGVMQTHIARHDWLADGASRFR